MPKDTRLSLVSGCIAGACEASATWPMEYIKTQLQSMRNLPAGKPPPYTGVLSGLRYTVQTSGVLTLYTGLTPTLVFSVPKAGIRFGGNQFFRNLLKDPTTGNVSTGKAFLAGLAAGVTESIAVVTPQETIKTKLINLNMSPIDGIKHIMRTEGPIGLYSGLLSTCMKQGGNHGSRFMFMSEYKRMYKGHSEAKLKPIESFLGGMGAGARRRAAQFGTQFCGAQFGGAQFSSGLTRARAPRRPLLGAHDEPVRRREDADAVDAGVGVLVDARLLRADRAEGGVGQLLLGKSRALLPRAARAGHHLHERRGDLQPARAEVPAKRRADAHEGQGPPVEARRHGLSGAG